MPEYRDRSLVNYLTGTVPEDPWWMYAFNVVLLLVCAGLLGLIAVEVLS